MLSAESPKIAEKNDFYVSKLCIEHKNQNVVFLGVMLGPDYLYKINLYVYKCKEYN